MKFVILPLLMMSSVMAFSDDCLFDMEQQFADKRAFLETHETAVLDGDHQLFIVQSKHGQLEYGFGGCQRYGVKLSLTTENVITARKIPRLVLDLVNEFDRLDVDMTSLKSELAAIEWSMTSQHYIVAVEGLSHFSISFAEDLIEVLYYVG